MEKHYSFCAGKNGSTDCTLTSETGDVDDPAVRLSEQREEGLGDSDHPQHVDVQDVLELVHGAPLDLRERGDARVVHHRPKRWRQQYQTLVQSTACTNYSFKKIKVFDAKSCPTGPF